MKRINNILILILLAVFISFTPAIAGNTDICLPIDEMADLTYQRIQRERLSEINQIQREKISELELQKEKLQEVITKSDENYNKAVEALSLSGKIIALKDSECKRKVDAVKPTFKRDAGIFGAGTLTGAVLVLLAIILL
ncbi:MAG: hypothetical protein ABIJ08_05325 [Nanoarchaeota archaeon]